jgi:flagellar basal-body rod protein FlgB
VLIADLINSGAIPTLELSMRFAGQRQQLLAHNIANISTPDYRPLDVSPYRFAQMLREAVDERRSRTGGERGELRLRSSREITVSQSSGGTRLTLNPRTPSGNILFHDRNNRDLERMMQANAENVAAYRISAELLKSRYDILKAAIAERA